jgi:formiminotetrahydrofolate cyclodeaminase
MELGLDALKYCERVAEVGNENSASDSGVGALLGMVCVRGAYYNVRINLNDIEDAAFCDEWRSKSEKLLDEAQEVHDRALEHMEKKL